MSRLSSLISRCSSLRYTISGRQEPSGTKNDFDHEGVRAGRREPAHDLQLALERQDRIRPHRWRIGSHLRRHALARPAPQPIVRPCRRAWRRLKDGTRPDVGPAQRRGTPREGTDGRVAGTASPLPSAEQPARDHPRARRAARGQSRRTTSSARARRRSSPARSKPWAPPRKFAASTTNPSLRMRNSANTRIVITVVNKLTTDWQFSSCY